MTRIKLLLSLTVLGFFSLAVGQDAPKREYLESVPSPNATVAGRYTILEGPSSLGGGSKRLFRLDTMTGRCWYLTGTDADWAPNKRLEMWIQVVEMDAALGMIRENKH